MPTGVKMACPTPETRLAPRTRPDRRAAMRQRWSRLLFLHWKIDPDLLITRLPDGLTLDTYEGNAFIGLVPFFMERIHPVGLPPLPWLSWFLELNVRTYVHDSEGRPGVWFFSLECNQPIAVTVARRFFHLPYEHARMQAKSNEHRVDYHCRRKGKKTEAAYDYSPNGEIRTASPGSFEFFLLERYLLFSSAPAGGLYSGQVHHPPYPFQNADVPTYDQHPLNWNGFRLKEKPCSLLYSPGVNVEVFSLETVQSG